MTAGPPGVGYVCVSLKSYEALKQFIALRQQTSLI